MKSFIKFQNITKKRSLYLGIFGMALLFATPLLATQKGPVQAILADVSGHGTLLHVDRFRINPEINNLPSKHIFIVGSKTLIAMRDQVQNAEEKALEKIARDEGWSEFGAAFNYSGAVGTLSEHVGQLEGLSNVNSALTELGLFMTVWQVSMDLSRGDNSSAGVDSYKGMLYYAIGKFGWPALQISSVAILAIDIALNTFGTEAWLARTDAWRQSYTAYYREGEAAMEAREFGPVAQVVPDTLEQAVKKIRTQKSGGRSIKQWKILLDYYYRKAKSPERFKSLVANEVDRYIGRYWNSKEFTQGVAGYRQTQVGIAPGSSLTDDIRKRLEDEHRTRLMAMFVVKVFPEIARKAWLRALVGQVMKMNRELRLELNDTYQVEVSAYGLSTPTQFFITKPSGGKWGGKIMSGKPRRFKITKLAYLRAGLPTTVTLMGPSGIIEKPLKFVKDKAIVVFGTPPAPRQIYALHATEGLQQCTINTHTKAGKTSRHKEVRPARPPLDIDEAQPVVTQVMFGKYDVGSGSWSLLSPGTFDATSYSTTFGAPYLDNIHRLFACEDKAMDLALFIDADCKFERHISTKDTNGTLTEIDCISPVHLTFRGVYTKMGASGLKFFSFEGERGKLVRESLRSVMKNLREVEQSQ
ncbi:hypothetical protein MNB_SV-6-773 [hydrothermal vent metagenome]|uniref:Uncharacterized protein n=1 Tax=hydrothermal vent metagenome TaxID=652676 RepID=A0A1W1BDC6_9ZZZZ